MTVPVLHFSALLAVVATAAFEVNHLLLQAAAACDGWVR